ncbi:putative D-cysteine desulfhydrase [Helianthus anomalus]
MKFILQRNPQISSVRHEFHSISPQVTCSSNSSSEELMLKMLNRRWTLMNPDTKVHQIKVSSMQTQRHFGPFGKVTFSNNSNPLLGENVRKWHNDESSFYIVRDDLLHPFVNGNKARKLDALLPLVEDHSGTDVVTCGGCQSAHAAAVERGLRAHLLLRGEQPQILTGYNLISVLYGNVTYVPRSIYANREGMLSSHANSIGGSVVCLNDLLNASTNHNSVKSNFLETDDGQSLNSRKTVIVNEGAGDAIALPGKLRVHFSVPIWKLTIHL